MRAWPPPIHPSTSRRRIFCCPSRAVHGRGAAISASPAARISTPGKVRAAAGGRSQLGECRRRKSGASRSCRRADMSKRMAIRSAFSLSAPATMRGAAGGTLQLADLTLQGSAQDLHGPLHAALGGRRLARRHARPCPSFTWSGGDFHAQTVSGGAAGLRRVSRRHARARQGTVTRAIGRMDIFSADPARS